MAEVPITHISYSALNQLLKNPFVFKMKYVLKCYDAPSSPSSVVGRAGHAALQAYYGGVEGIQKGDIAAARAHGLDYIANYPDFGINYGKTGSREDMLTTYARAVDFYFSEEPEVHEILAVEERMEDYMTTIDGETVLPIMGVGQADQITRNAAGEIEIIDFKFTKTFSDPEKERGARILQAMFMFHLAWKKYGEMPARMIFREIKTSLNKDGTKQVQDWFFPFDHKPYFVFFYNIFNDAVRFLSGEAVYLPNFDDIYDGDYAMEVYAQSLTTADMSDVAVVHKIREVERVQRKFVESVTERAGSETLLPEEKIKVKLSEFGIPAIPQDSVVGPTVTQYRFKVSAGVKMSTIKKYADDIQRVLAAPDAVTILAPIPGTDLVGVEVVNENRTAVDLTLSMMRKNTLSIPIGARITGETYYENLDDMPHLLVAGASGTGKSVFINSLIHSLTTQMSPNKLDMILIDPKRVELAAFVSLPHVRAIHTESEDIYNALLLLQNEMQHRYKRMERAGVKNIKEIKTKMPYIACVIDEFADLILSDNGKEIERVITRIAQLGRAAGIHLVVATQRPSVNVITGVIKANFPCRVALTTSSQIDSKVIIDDVGAEKLAGRGDMIYKSPQVKGGTIRLQGYLS